MVVVVVAAGVAGVAVEVVARFVVDETMPMEALAGVAAGVPGRDDGLDGAETELAAVDAIVLLDDLTGVGLARMVTGVDVDAAGEAATVFFVVCSRITTGADCAGVGCWALRPGGAGKVGFGGRDARPVPGRDAQEAVRGRADAGADKGQSSATSEEVRRRR